MESITLKDEFIKLGQAMKLANLVEDGVEATLVIQDAHKFFDIMTTYNPL